MLLHLGIWSVPPDGAHGAASRREPPVGGDPYEAPFPQQMSRSWIPLRQPQGAQNCGTRAKLLGQNPPLKLKEIWAVTRFGGIDVLVNDAGIAGHGRLEDVSDFGWYEEMMRVNHMGTVWCTRYALAALRKSKGLVVGIPGMMAKVGVPEHTALTASKCAQAGFLEALRTELVGTGVDVTAAFPALVATDIRKHAFGPDGKLTSVSLLDESRVMPVAECARQIIAGMRARKRELLMTHRARFVPWLKLFAPQIVQKMAQTAVKTV